MTATGDVVGQTPFAWADKIPKRKPRPADDRLETVRKALPLFESHIPDSGVLLTVVQEYIKNCAGLKLSEDEVVHIMTALGYRCWPRMTGSRFSGAAANIVVGRRKGPVT